MFAQPPAPATLIASGNLSEVQELRPAAAISSLPPSLPRPSIFAHNGLSKNTCKKPQEYSFIRDSQKQSIEPKSKLKLDEDKATSTRYHAITYEKHCGCTYLPCTVCSKRLFRQVLVKSEPRVKSGLSVGKTRRKGRRVHSSAAAGWQKAAIMLNVMCPRSSMVLREMAWVWETRRVSKPCICSTIA